MSNPSQAPDKGSNPGTVYVLAFYLIVIFVLSLGLIISSWPNAERTPSWLGAISAELRYVILVACGGALGAALNTFRSLMEVLGNRTSVRGWLLWYALRVLVGIPLAMISYLVIRGILLSPQAEIANFNPYGILIASIFMGMFSMQALDKLNTIASSLFAPATELEKQIDRIGAALGVATLDNYQGYVCLSFRDLQGKIAFESHGGRPLLKPGKHYELVSWFQPDKPEGMLADEVRITGGTDAKEIEFKLLPNGDSLSPQPAQETVTFPINKTSREVNFKFQAPEKDDPYDIWVEVFQKNRLIHVISTSVNVNNPKASGRNYIEP